MLKLYDAADEIVREHMDYITGEGRTPWDALCAREGPCVVSREPVNWLFVEKQYRKAYARLPKPMSMPSGFGKGRAA